MADPELMLQAAEKVVNVLGRIRALCERYRLTGLDELIEEASRLREG